MSFTKKPGGAYVTNIGLCLTKQSEVRNSNFVIGLTLVRTSLSRHRGSASFALVLRSKGEGVIQPPGLVTRLTPIRVYIYVLIELHRN